MTVLRGWTASSLLLLLLVVLKLAFLFSSLFWRKLMSLESSMARPLIWRYRNPLEMGGCSFRLIRLPSDSMDRRPSASALNSLPYHFIAALTRPF